MEFYSTAFPSPSYPKKNRAGGYHLPLLYAWLIFLSLAVAALAGLCLWLAIRDPGCTVCETVPPSTTTTTTTTTAAPTTTPPPTTTTSTTTTTAPTTTTTTTTTAPPSTTAPPIISEVDGQSYAFCSSGTGAVGATNATGWVYDDCDALYIVASRFITPSNLSVAQSTQICAYIGESTEENGNQYRLAVYEDDGFGVPGRLIANTEVGTIATEAYTWNCLPLTMDLGESTYLWMAFMTNGATCGELNNIHYTPHLQLRAGFTDLFTWPNFPATLPTLAYFSAVYSMYLDYNATCIGPY